MHMNNFLFDSLQEKCDLKELKPLWRRVVVRQEVVEHCMAPFSLVTLAYAIMAMASLV